MSVINELDTGVEETIIGIERFISGKVMDGEVVLDHVTYELKEIKALRIQLMSKLYGLHGFVASLDDKQ